MLTDPIKRIDYDKELAGGNVGYGAFSPLSQTHDDMFSRWGWNQEAAKERARNYHWNGDDMLFNLGDSVTSAMTKILKSCFHQEPNCIVHGEVPRVSFATRPFLPGI